MRNSLNHWIFMGFLGVLILLDVGVGLLFYAGKSDLEILRGNLFFLTPILYHSPWIVFLILIVSLVLTLIYVFRCSRVGYSIHQSGKVLILLLALGITIFPFGNLLKHNALFYEKWMWYCAFWICGLCVSLVGSAYLGRLHPHWLEEVGDRLEIVDRFLSRQFFCWGDWLFLGVLFLWVGLASWAINVWVFHGIPHIYDEIAQLFQAKVFAWGFLTAPAPPEPQFFERMYIPIESGRWYSIYPPGYSLILALGVVAGETSWVNPLISAVIVPLFFFAASRVSSFYIARLGSLFLALSPFVLLMGGGYMNHPACLAILLLFLAGYEVSFSCPEKRRRGSAAFGAGLCAGMAFLIRPLTALAFLGAAALAGIILKRYRRQGFWKLYFVLVLGALPAIGFFLYFNQHTTGSPLVTGYEHYFDANPMGFGAKPWGPHPLGPQIPRGEYHTPLRAVANTICNLNALNLYLFGWPVPSLLFAFLLFCPGFKRTRMDWFCLAVIGSVCGVYFFYFFQDVCFGPRFLYETIPFWILLSARGVEELSHRCEATSPLTINQRRGLIYPLIVFYFAAAMGTAWMELLAEYGDSYWGTREELADVLREGVRERDAVILVEDSNDHLAVFSFLDPRLDRGWIIAHDLGEEENQKLLRRYPEWPVYRLRLKEVEGGDEIRTVLERVGRF